MKLSGLEVAVVGGAVAGASTALLLARAGAHVRLLEREPRARPVGAGIAIAENGLAVLKALGLGAELATAGSEVHGVRLVDGRGRTLFAPPSGKSAAGMPGGESPRVLMVRRSALYGLLGRAVAEEPRISCEYGVRVQAASDSGAVTLQRDDAVETLQAELVVGADGVHSRVRDDAAFGARVSKAGISYARGLVAAPLARGEEAWTREGLFGSFPLPDGSYWYASLGTARLRRALADRDLGGFRAIWSEAYAPAGPLLAQLSSFDELIVNEVVRVRCRRFFSGKRVLVGDAAHAMAPNLGQGANSALVDAAVLVDELARAATLAEGLAAYDARRRPKVEAVAQTAARLGALAEYTNPVVRLLRDRVLMPLAGRADSAAQARAVWQEDPAELAQIGLQRA